MSEEKLAKLFNITGIFGEKKSNSTKLEDITNVLNSKEQNIDKYINNLKKIIINNIGTDKKREKIEALYDYAREKELEIAKTFLFFCKETIEQEKEKNNHKKINKEEFKKCLNNAEIDTILKEKEKKDNKKEEDLIQKYKDNNLDIKKVGIVENDSQNRKKIDYIETYEYLYNKLPNKNKEEIQKFVEALVKGNSDFLNVTQSRKEDLEKYIELGGNAEEIKNQKYLAKKFEYIENFIKNKEENKDIEIKIEEKPIEPKEESKKNNINNKIIENKKNEKEINKTVVESEAKNENDKIKEKEEYKQRMEELGFKEMYKSIEGLKKDKNTLINDCSCIIKNNLLGYLESKEVYKDDKKFIRDLLQKFEHSFSDEEQKTIHSLLLKFNFSFLNRTEDRNKTDKDSYERSVIHKLGFLNIHKSIKNLRDVNDKINKNLESFFNKFVYSKDNSLNYLKSSEVNEEDKELLFDLMKKYSYLDTISEYINADKEDEKIIFDLMKKYNSISKITDNDKEINQKEETREEKEDIEIKIEEKKQNELKDEDNNKRKEEKNKNNNFMTQSTPVNANKMQEIDYMTKSLNNKKGELKKLNKKSKNLHKRSSTEKIVTNSIEKQKVDSLY